MLYQRPSLDQQLAGTLGQGESKGESKGGRGESEGESEDQNTDDGEDEGKLSWDCITRAPVKFTTLRCIGSHQCCP